MRFWHWAGFLVTCAPFFKSPGPHVVLVFDFRLCRCTKKSRYARSSAAVITDNHLFAIFLVVARVSEVPCFEVEIEWWNSTNKGRCTVTFLRSFCDASSSENKKILLWGGAPINVWFLRQNFSQDSFLMGYSWHLHKVFFFSQDFFRMYWLILPCLQQRRRPLQPRLQCASDDNVGRRD